MIVVMGATGRVGQAILRELASTEQRVRALSRRGNHETSPGVEWVVADAFDSASLVTAFDGAEAVFVMNTVGTDSLDVIADSERMSMSIAAALLKARVPYAVALSSQGAHLAAGTGIVTTLNRFEGQLRGTQTRFTFLRSAYFMESWIPLAQAAMNTGELPSFIRPYYRAIDTVSARDVGKLAARYLLEPKPGVVNVVGPTRYSDENAAMLVSEIRGRTVSVISIPADSIAAAHEAVGIGPSSAAAIAGMYEAINDSGIPFDTNDRFSVGKTTLREVLVSSLSSHR